MEHSETLAQILQRASATLFPDPDCAPGSLTVHSRGTSGDMPLHVAALWGDRHAVRVLIDAGAEVDVKGEMLCTPLSYAVMEQHVLVAEALLHCGADPDAVNELADTPRTLAALKGDNHMRELFRRHNAVRKGR